MSLRAAVQTAVLTLTLLIGVGLGLILSFEAWPATCVSAAPHELSKEARCLWMAWSASAYARDGDLTRARGRVILLGEEPPSTLCDLASGRCATCTAGQQTAGALLAQALGVNCDE